MLTASTRNKSLSDLVIKIEKTYNISIKHSKKIHFEYNFSAIK
ncbi:hypothetical protein VCHA48O429_70043 [Vibrio chagasii]|nr:hypothetical protein VCHA32P90_80172 [Vibrio chagasii]CAH7361649.1 hypothetical protein VCHA53O469_70172 [Vibrio chagasii]CAH7378252.1 hypothetical protein VCHA39P230_80046 [Vibrio chagasii]CAH7470657.1 hypothetical protein VCHA48O429_70043 [Vibrio chagasii]CAH7471124.1 hypothetical protein VCHA55O506_80046 [Vibrio chagasii]